MKYVIRIDRPLIDDGELDIECPSKEDAAIGVVHMIEMCRMFEPGFEVLGMEQTETHLTVRTSTGTIRAFPRMKGLH